MLSINEVYDFVDLVSNFSWAQLISYYFNLNLNAL